MADKSPKPLVDQIIAEKAVVAERIEHLHINITRGLDELPTRYDSRVQNFLEYYLGAKDHPAPFGGRASDLGALDAWMDDPAAPPYASLIAPAGRGKSALLAHWVTRLASRAATGSEAVHVVYFPISIRFNTNLETVVFASLAARIAHIYGEKVTYTSDTNQYRGVFSDYLRRTPPNGGRVLVVMDGLNEAAGWEAGADLFPTVAPGHLRVLVAARPLALDKDETAWLNRLGWETPNAARRLSLAGLDREGVRDVLSQMGNPLDALATKIDLISRLYELSAGDPLLVRLYVEALLPQGAQAATLTPDDLTKLQPGLEAYFKRWFEEQQKLWGAAKPLQDKTVRGLLNLCAAALGPLKKDDVLVLAPDIFEDSGLLDEAAKAVNRFIIGDGLASGFVFSHSRLAEYFAGKLTDRERQAWQARFLQYGRDTLTALENKTLLPKNAPAYAVQYYGAHLAQANASATDFYALVCETWLRAWEWLEGTPAGFLNDAKCARKKAEGPAALGQQIRADLCLASVASLSANIPKDLLVACVKAGVISPALGLVMARQKLDIKERAECLAAIAEFHLSESNAIMNEALSAARAISDEESRVRVLAAIAQRLPKCEQTGVFDEALALACAMSHWLRARMLMEIVSLLPASLLEKALVSARTISDNEPRAKALAEIAPRLPKREHVEVLGEALVSARAISDQRSRTEVLVKIASQLPEYEQAAVFEEALALARAISDEWSRNKVLLEIVPQLPEGLLGDGLVLIRMISDGRFRVKILVEMTPRLPEHEQAKVLEEALALARAISDNESRAKILTKIAPQLPEREQEKVLGEALLAASTISDESSRARVLIELAPRLPEHLCLKALSVVRIISDNNSRARVLRELALRLREREQAKVLEEALSSVRAISDEKPRTKVLEIIALRLPEREQVDMLRKVLSIASAISDELPRAEVLGALASRLPESLLKKALSIAGAISLEWPRSEVLRALVPRLPESLLGETVLAARAISDEEPRANILGELAPRFSEHEQVKIFGEALSAVREISHERPRAKVLGTLAPRLPESLLGEALSMARAMFDEGSRARALGKLAQRFPGREQARVFDEALSAVRSIFDERSRVHILRELAPLLSENLLGEVLSMVRMISDEESRSHFLEELAPRLLEDLLGEALSMARAISDEVSCAHALMKLALRLSEREKAEVLREALSRARAISVEWHRARVLGELASLLLEREQTEVLEEALLLVHAISHEWSRAEVLEILASQLPESLLEEAMSAARAISGAGSLARVLRALAPHLPESLLGEALQMARVLCHQDKIIAALSALAARWSAVCRSTQRSEFEELSLTLRAFARTKRPQLLQAIQALLPVIAEQGGMPALRETARAIVDTAKWWP